MNNFISFNDFQAQVRNYDLDKQSKNSVDSQNIPKENNSTPKQDEIVLSSSLDAISELEKQYKDAMKNNGWIEKIADKIKNKTNIGFGSKKIENAINQVKQGEITKEEAEKLIKKYRSSQETTSQTFIDVIQILLMSSLFFMGKNQLGKLSGIAKLNKESILNKENIDFVVKNKAVKRILTKKNFTHLERAEDLFNKVTNKKTISFVVATLLAPIGGIAKKTLNKFNAIGLNKYKPEIDKNEMTDSEIRKENAKAKKQKKKANSRNFHSGAINVLLMPIVGILGAAGTPIYLALNMLNRYFIGSREDENNKSISSFIENIKDSKIAHAIGAILITLPLIKKGQYSDKLFKNTDSVVKKLKETNYTPMANTKTTYSELEEIIINDDSVLKILYDSNLSTSQKIEKLREENIFALKFKQIQENDFDSITKALKESCPETWTIEDAQKHIEGIFGGKYKIKKIVGSGTVAQTFLATDQNGKEVCVKLLHRGITAEKIQADKEKFINMINATSKSQKEKDFLIKNIENISSSVLAEVDLTNEMKSAEKLAQVTKQAMVVRPIEVKDGAYVMEKASGISLKSLQDFMMNYPKLTPEQTNATIETCNEKIANLIQEINKTQGEYEKAELRETLMHWQTAKTAIENPSLANLTIDEKISMIDQYQKVLIEQFSKIDPNGKTIHGDIHAGNIFIDLDKLKAKKDKKFFTLIDTGNTVNQSASQAIRFMNLTQYINNGDIDNMAKYVLEGAILPEGMTKEIAYKNVSTALKNIFYEIKDGKAVKTGTLTNDKVLGILDEILKTNNIIPPQAQGGLTKAKQSAQNSLSTLKDIFQGYYETRIEQLTKNMTNMLLDGDMPKDISNISEKDKEKLNEMAKKMVAESSEFFINIGKMKFKNSIRTKFQEIANLFKMPFREYSKLKKSANIPKGNSEEALIYKLKQYRKEPPKVNMQDFV